jgi:DNA (cytosine-5)-methyltransferase 1
MLSFGSLFAGIGGIDLGFERAGFRLRWQVEKDEFCRKVLAKHWPDVPKFEDVKNCGKHNLESVDVICGGFPCQPHSYAGNRRGAEDDRHLWPEMLRIVGELKPGWVLGENVPGIASTILDQVLSDLESLGYETATIDIPACGVNAPHRRHRIFIIANRQSDGWQQGNQDAAGSVEGISARQEQRFDRVCRSFPNADRQRQQKQRRSITTRTAYDSVELFSQWEVEPGICRVVDGFPGRVDRLRGLGNAVVPQVAQLLATNLWLAHNHRLHATGTAARQIVNET